MMNRSIVTAAIILLTSLSDSAAQFHTYNDRFTVHEYASREDWERRASDLRQRILASAGLLPMPAKTPLNAQVFGERTHEDYAVFKVYFESLPGFFVTGNLYRPAGTGPFPAILSPHGHWPYGRLENTDVTSAPARMINLAKQGFVVFSYDMIGYNDSRQLTHEFLGKRETLWGLSLPGLQLLNSIRSLDFLESLPYVNRDRIGCTGESGGGTQTFLLAAVDDRVKVAAPVNMISLHMQGGCVCENAPGLRLDTNNVELAAVIAPRPLLMVSATGDWTKNTLEVEYPAMRKLYALAGAGNAVEAVQFDAPHNYNRQSREAVYAWMARWLKNAPADTRIADRPFQAETAPDALVFYGRSLPEQAISREQLTANWIAAARQQLKAADQHTMHGALVQTLALPSVSSKGQASKTVVLAGGDQTMQAALTRAGYRVRRVVETPFDADAAAKIAHFETYNRTQASQRVADIVHAMGGESVTLVAGSEWGPAALLALAATSVDRAIVDVGQFDNGGDAAFVERLYIPGIRRAGDFQTALSGVADKVLIHNAGEHFKVEGAKVEPRQLTPTEVVKQLKRPRAGT